MKKWLLSGKSKFYSGGNSCYYSVQTLLSFRLLSKSLKIKKYKTIILPVVLYGCEACGRCHSCPWSHGMWPKKALQYCGGDTSSCPGPYPTAVCLEFNVDWGLGQELFSLPICYLRCPWSHRLQPKKAVTQTLVRLPTQRPLVPSFT